MDCERTLSIVIPSYNERSLIPTLESLRKSHSEEYPIDIILVFNASALDSKEVKGVNQKAFDEVEQYKGKFQSNYFNLIPIIEDALDPKKAGVGLARKIGMDMAANQFRIQEVDGVIACLDADCIVADNYIKALYKYFEEQPKIKACSIYFEHLFDPLDDGLMEGIIQYEIHLRYYKQALEFCGFPWPYHTVGSSMAVRSSTYLKSGGMNTRQAGEDFYFLQKLFSQYAFGELNETTVYPLGRLSARVPFGTGAAMNKWDEAGRIEMPTYDVQSFVVIKDFLHEIENIECGMELSNVISNAGKASDITRFLKSEGIQSLLDSEQFINAKPIQMKAMFFRWFNNFRILKCLNYLRESGFSSGTVLSNACELLELIGYEAPATSEEVLYLYRKLDKLASQRKLVSN